MANYRQIHVKIWKDPWFLELEPDEKLLFTYLITNEQTNLAGIYEISHRVIAFETCLDTKRIEEILMKFSEAGKVYNQDTIIWVVNMRQYHENTSDKVKQRIVSDVDNIPYCDLLQQYIAYYPPPIGYRYDIDTISLKEEEEEEDKDEDENGKEEEYSPPFPTILQTVHAQDIFTTITGMTSVPNGGGRYSLKTGPQVLEDICRLRKKYETRPAMIDDGKKYWKAWIEDFGYKKTNNGWLDWWISGEIPVQSANTRPERASDPRKMSKLEARRRELQDGN